jgi:hypothetical protein
VETGCTTIDLLDALQRPGCPICTIGELSARRYLDYALYARVTEAGFRTEVRASRGFCAEHAQVLTTFHGASLGIAMLCYDVVADLLTALQSLDNGQDTRSRPRMRAPSHVVRLAAQGVCPGCAFVQRVDTIYLSRLLATLADPAVASAFVRGDGLCLCHLAQVLRY